MSMKGPSSFDARAVPSDSHTTQACIHSDTFVSCRELRSSHGLHSFSALNTAFTHAFTAHEIVLVILEVSLQSLAVLDRERA
jgi:hypothetical protein